MPDYGNKLELDTYISKTYFCPPSGSNFFLALLFYCVYNIPLSLSLAILLGEGGSSLGSGLKFLVRVGTFAEPIIRIRR